MTKPGDLASRLYDWATKEMQFRPPPSYSRMPTTEDFRVLTRGHNADVWKYVIQNVASTKTVAKIRGNLKLHEQRESFADLEAENEKKSQQIKKLNSDIEHLEKDVKQMRQQIQYTEGKLSKNTAKLFNTKKRTTLLYEFSAQSNEQMEIFSYFQQEVSKRLKACERAPDSQKPVYYSSQSVAKVETACQKNVRECIEKIQIVLGDINLAGRSSMSLTLNDFKETWQKRAEPIILKFPVTEIIEALMKLTQESSLDLKGKTANIDFQQEPLELKYKFEKADHVTDQSHTPSPLQSVHQLMLEGQKDHAGRYVETEKINAQTNRDRLQIEELKTAIDADLQDMFVDEPEKLLIARALVILESNNVGYDAALSSLEEQSLRLRKEISKADQRKEVLQKKHEQILNFEKIMLKNNNEIEQVRRCNSKARNRLENYHAQMEEYVKSSVGSHYQEIQQLVDSLSQFVATEAEKFSVTSLPHQMMIDIKGVGKVPIMDLSINQLNPDHSSTAQKSMLEILSHLNFPVFKASEHILTHVSSLKADMAESECSYHMTVMAGESPESKKQDLDSIQQAEELFETLEKYEEVDMKELNEKLQEELKKAKANINTCPMLRHRLEEWEHQPGQHTVSWVKVNGTNYAKWLEWWKVAATQLRKLKVDIK